MSNKAYYDEKLSEIPKDFLEECVKLIQKEFEQEEIDEIKNAYEQDGEIEWAIPYHHGWGTNVRNLLRQEGCLDYKLPDKNWDDYYIQVIELALGLRSSTEK
jgi:hypothetical protein